MTDQGQEIGAALFGSPTSGGADGDEDTTANGSTELDAEQAELARRYSLTAEDVARVRGDTWAEKCEDAERLAGMAEPQSVRDRARRHLDAMQDNPNEAVLGVLTARKRGERELVELMHPPEPKDET